VACPPALPSVSTTVAPGGRARDAIRAALRYDLLVLAAFPLLKLAVHLAAGAGYGYHRDELYSLVCADHLGWGYVDHPPLSIAILALLRPIVGSSLTALRVVPALAGALTVFMIGLMARDLGGGVFARALAMGAAVVAPFYLSLDAYYSMNAFDLLAWTVAGWLLIRLLQGANPREWLLLGLLVGLASENKISALWLGGGIGVALLLTTERDLLRTREPWIAAAIAAVCFTPYVLWQATHGWATLHFIHDATAEKLIHVSPAEFLDRQFAGMLYFAVPVWAAGLAYYLFLPEGRRLRALGWLWVAVFALLAANGASRGAYLAPAFAWLLAAGGVVIERWRGPFYAWLRIGLVGAMAAEALVSAPLSLPLMPERTLAAFAIDSGANLQVEERHAATRVPEFLAHMSGWPQLVDSIAQAAVNIPAADRRSAVVLASDYGMAAAIDVLGPARGLPAAATGHNSYWLWGPPQPWPDVTMVIGDDKLPTRGWFEEVRLVGWTQCEFCMPYENHRSIWVARRLRVPPRQLWQRLQMYE
jgi:hypothetical protein